LRIWNIFESFEKVSFRIINNFINKPYQIREGAARKRVVPSFVVRPASERSNG
jgi:hypothetical protein